MRTTSSPVRVTLAAFLSLTAVALLAAAVSARSSFSGAPITFGTGNAYTTNSGFNQPQFHDVGDLNGDGVPDAVVSDGSSPATLRLLVGTGGGGFSSPISLNISVASCAPLTSDCASNTYRVMAADVDADGDLDLVTANNHSANLSVVPNAGGGVFLPATTYPVPGGTRAAAAGDLNGDGVMDLVAGSIFSNVVVFLGKAASPGSFEPGVTYTDAGNNRQSVVIADVTGDGRNDVIAGNRDSSDFSVFAGNGDGTLSAGIQYGTGATPGTARGDSLVVKDFNGDGRLDIAAPDDSLTHVIVYLNQGGTFGAATSYPTGGFHSLFLDTADFNQDGHVDLVVSNNQTANFSILAGDGTGAFGPPTTFPNPVNSTIMHRPWHLRVADFDQDGRTDVSMVDLHHKRLVVFLNDTLTAPSSCDPGSYLSGNACVLAPAGSYSEGGTATSATLCPAGTYSNTAGAPACTPSPAGSYVPNAGATSATACPAHHSSNAGATSCFALDTDGDGVKDFEDAVINSNVSASVTVGACSAGVPNKVLPNGATFNDLLSAAVAGSANHGAVVSGVSQLSNGWKSAGLISGRDHGAIVSCVAKSK